MCNFISLLVLKIYRTITITILQKTEDEVLKFSCKLILRARIFPWNVLYQKNQPNLSNLNIIFVKHTNNYFYNCQWFLWNALNWAFSCNVTYLRSEWIITLLTLSSPVTKCLPLPGFENVGSNATALIGRSKLIVWLFSTSYKPLMTTCNIQEIFKLNTVCLQHLMT